MFNLNYNKVLNVSLLIIVLFVSCIMMACSESSSSEPAIEIPGPTNPTPANGAVNVLTNILLKWECNDTGDPYTYDLYFGIETNPPLLAGNTNQKQYQKDSLQFNKLYYWKVVVKDNRGKQADGPIWSFTTESVPLDGRGGGIIMYTLQPNSDIHQLYVVNADGTGERKLITASIGLNHADWSPDGNKIAAVGYPDGNFNTWSIYTFNADGTDLARLTSMSNVSDTDPAWSPSGNQIIFTRMIRQNSNYENARREIWIMNSDGSNLRYWGKLGFQPKFSPDGSKLLYTSNVSGNWEIYKCNIDTTNEERLTNNNAVESNAVWSPDGSQIAFDSDRDGNSEIYIMSSDGTNVRRITNNNVIDLHPRWSPDSSLLSFVSEMSEPWHWEVYIMNTDGTDIRKLTTSPGINTAINAVWKPM